MSESVEFEKLTAEIFSILRNNPTYESVTHNAVLPGKDGTRQIDILIRGRIGPFEILTIVECKDYNRNVNITVVDALHSKMQDVNVHKAVLVARKGFAKQAIKKAIRLGISLCTVHKAKSEKWEIPVELPVVLEEITPILRPAFTLKIDEQQTFNRNAPFIINDINILDEFKNNWNNNLIEINNNKSLYEWQPKYLTPPYFIRNIKNDIININNLSLQYELSKIYYFGYINNLNNSKAIQFIIEGNINLIYNNIDLIDYKNFFKKYSSYNEVPNNKAFTLRYLAIPEIEMGSPQFSIKKVD